MRVRAIYWGSFVVRDPQGRAVATRNCAEDASAEVQERRTKDGVHFGGTTYMELHVDNATARQ